MNLFKIPIVLATLALPFQFSLADSLVLKNGEEIVGKIIREDADKVVIEIKVTKSITDERTFTRDEIQTIRQESADDERFKEIEKFLPAADLLSEQKYEEHIELIEQFIAEYPDSSNVKTAKAMLETLGKELKMIQAGSFKFDGEMVTEEDYNANAFEYDAAIAEKELQEAVSRGDFLLALRLFEKYEEKFVRPENFDEMRILILKVLRAYGESINQNLESFAKRVEIRDMGLEQMSSEDRAVSKRAIQDKDALIEARLAEEKAAKMVWVTPESFNEESLKITSTEVEKAIKRLENPVQKSLEEALEEVYRKTWGGLGTASEKRKVEIMDELAKSGISQYYIEKLEQRAGN